MFSRFFLAVQYMLYMHVYACICCICHWDGLGGSTLRGRDCYGLLLTMSRHVKTATFVAFSNSALQRVHQGHQDIPDLNIFLKASEKVLKDFGKNDFGRFGVTFGVTTVTTFQVPRPRCDRHQTLRGQSARRHSGVDSEVLWKGCDCSCLCCTLAIWQYGNMATGIYNNNIIYKLLYKY